MSKRSVSPSFSPQPKLIPWLKLEDIPSSGDCNYLGENIQQQEDPVNITTARQERLQAIEEIG